MTNKQGKFDKSIYKLILIQIRFLLEIKTRNAIRIHIGFIWFSQC